MADLEKNGQLKRIDYPADPFLEIGMIQRRALRAKAPALLFTNPKNCAFPMLANLFGTRERVNFIFRDTLENLKELFETAGNFKRLLKKPGFFLKNLPLLLPSFSNGKLPVLDKTCKLSDLPKLVSWPQDGGSFITLPLVLTEDPEKSGAYNLGMYRIQLDGNEYAANETGMHYQLKRGIGTHHAKALSKRETLPVRVFVGGSPALIIAAIMPLPEGINEILFANLLAGRRIKAVKKNGFSLPVLGQCDFMMTGEIGDKIKPEGPFGDHMGYYSLRHDFPVMKVTRVNHRSDAIWPFTTVGRPPQEDSVFGDFIHELTGPLASKVFPGVKTLHAVDAAGVHPLLLAIGSERYTPYLPVGHPAELITQAMHLLGTTQTALAKYLLITASMAEMDIKNVVGFISHMLERTDFSRDLHFITNTTTDTLDYSGQGLNEGSKLIWVAGVRKIRHLSSEISGNLQLPPGFGQPRLVASGILAISGTACNNERGQSDPRIEKNFCEAISRWDKRENFPLVVICDDSVFLSQNYDNFLWKTFTASDPATDIYGVNAQVHAKHWGCMAPLVIDARSKLFHAQVLEEDPILAARVENLARKGGPLEGFF